MESNKVVKNFPGTTAITNEELFKLDVDILAPCALDGVIHEKNADGIKAKIIIEGANGPTSIEGDRILEEKGCTVVPDILANGGGVVVSYFEWVQDVQNYFWDEPQIDENMQKILTRAFNKVYQFSQSEKVSMRAAAMAVLRETSGESHAAQGPLSEMSQGGSYFRPWLWLPPHLAHDLSPHILPLLAALTPGFDNRWSPLKWQGLYFSNPLGLAGGVDKNGSSLNSWKKLGAGFLEVGTVTPKPQKAFPGRILCRDKKAQALWNKMGFPNAGADALARTLGKFQKNGTPLFINIGKNRWTENHRAFDDCLFCIQKLHSYADAFVINLSSPNTQGLRDLLETSRLKNFLSSLKNQMPGEAIDKPLLLKLSPDEDRDSLKGILEVSLDFVHGWILTNSTKKTVPIQSLSVPAGGNLRETPCGPFPKGPGNRCFI